MLPLPDGSVDRLLLAHALEAADRPDALLEEAVAHHRARGANDRRSFPPAGASGRARTARPTDRACPIRNPQLRDLLHRADFSPVFWGEALYAPPIARPFMMRSAPTIERVGGGDRTALRRRPYRRGDQAGLPRRSPSARSRGLGSRRSSPRSRRAPGENATANDRRRFSGWRRRRRHAFKRRSPTLQPRPNPMPADRLLVLLRHGQSEWNLKNLFTGWRDVDLSPAGRRGGQGGGAAAQGARESPSTSPSPRPSFAPSTRSLWRWPNWGRPACRKAATRRSTSATTAISPASTRTMRARNGARSRSTSGGAATTSSRPAAKASRTRWRARSPIIARTFFPAVLGGKRVLVAAHGNSLRALGHGARPPHARDDPDDGARDRRAARLSPERRFDRRVQGDPGLTVISR